MRELADWMPFVLPSAPACPQPVAEKYIREAAITFCARTRCWRVTDKFPVSGSYCEVLCVPQYATIHEIEQAMFYNDAACRRHGREIDRVPFKDVDESCGPVITEVGPSAITVYTPDPGWVRLSIFMKPTIDAEGLEEFLFDRFAREIGWGALREILILANQPFSSPTLAAMFSQRFEDALDHHFNLAIRGQQRAPARTTAAYF